MADETLLENLNPEESSDVEAEINHDQLRKTEFGMVQDRGLVLEMEQSYLDYAMSVIVSRALPDVRDGLKPVHRRVLYAMWDNGLRYNAKFSKCAGVVGEVMKKYHPHGDMAIYDTLARMAQSWSMRYRLIDGQGNFGSIDGHEPAAMRYTEARLHRISDELLRDIDKETVEFRPNYDGAYKEPKVLPANLPNLLLNGAQGIAVGMATNIPPHNLTELLDGIAHLIDNPDAELDDLMQFIKGPDFPTGANIYNIADIKQAYSTGKGRIMMRATTEIVEKKSGFQIIISDLPYQVNKAALITKIAELVKDKRIEGISDIRDESDRKENIRVVVELKSTAYPKKILNRLYDLTPLQSAFHVNMLALVNGIQPQVLTLKQVLEYFILHRVEVIRKRTEYELRKARERAHILEGLLIALNDIDAVIETIRRSKDRDDARVNLISKFKLDEIQANAILDMRLSQLAALERQRIEDEYKALMQKIGELEAILASEQKIREVVKAELLETKERFGDERRTTIHPNAVGEFSAMDLIPDEQVVVVLTQGNYIKRMPITTYRSQNRGGKGVLGMTTKEEDEIQHLVTTSTHDDIFFFTNTGRVFQTKVYELPSASRQAKGTPLVNVIQILNAERVTAVMTKKHDDTSKKYFVFATKSGLIKRSLIEDYKNVRKTGIVAMRIDKGDELKWVHRTTGNDQIFQATAKGQAISYVEEEVRPVGRSAGGVKGIALRTGDTVISMDVIDTALKSQPDLLIVLENGFGKRTSFEHFRTQHRGGLGLKCANVTDKTGDVVGVEVVADEKMDALLISRQGVVLRTPLKEIRKLGRDTQGVTLMRMEDADSVASVAILSREEPVETTTNETAVETVTSE
ncbi:MAG TPA: DNA gyrase subunit A [Patescibacteria group bacterium]